jgi:hypothetical protein
VKTPETEDGGTSSIHDKLQLLLTQIRTRPWWGYTCVVMGGLFAVMGSIDLLSLITGFDLSWLSGLASGLLTLALLACLVCTLIARFVRDSPPDNRPMLKLAGVLAAGGIACTLVGTLIPALFAASAAADAARTDTHQFAGGRGQISIPGNWQQNEELSRQMGALIMSDLDKNLFLYVNGVMRVDSTARSFERFAQGAASKFKSQLRQTEVVETRQSTAARFELTETRINCVLEDTKAQYLARYVDCGDLWVEARVWGPVSAMQEHSELASQILDSIEPTK